MNVKYVARRQTIENFRSTTSFQWPLAGLTVTGTSWLSVASAIGELRMRHEKSPSPTYSGRLQTDSFLPGD